MQLSKVAELINFLGFMTQTGKGKWCRNVAETLLRVDMARNDPKQTERSLSF